MVDVPADASGNEVNAHLELDMEDNQNSGINDMGQRVRMQQALPNKEVEETRYYFCTRLNHHMHREDGKRILFVHQIYKTNNYYDQRYLQREIRYGNEFIRAATPQEIERYNMIIDPKGTIASELRPQIEAQVTAQMTAQLQALVSKGAMTQEQLDMLTGDTNLLAGAGNGLDNGPANPGIRSGTATLRPTAATIKDRVAALNAGHKLGGITGTDKLAGAADSNTVGA